MNIGNKRWFLTFSTDSPVSTGFAVVMARDPKSAETALKLQGTTFTKDAKVLAAAELDFSGGFCGATQILAEGVTTQGVQFIPYLDEEGNLTWANDGGLPNPAPINIMGPQGKQGEPGKQGEQGRRGLQGPVGDPFTYDMFTPEQLEALRGPEGKQGLQGIPGQDGQQGPSGVQIVGSILEIKPTTDVAVLDTNGPEVLLLTKEDLPTKVSELENDKNYATVSYVNRQIASLDTEVFLLVSELPTLENVKENKIYLLHENDNVNTPNNRYNEYKAIIEPTGIKWELIGFTQLGLNLEEYYNKTVSDERYQPKGSYYTTSEIDTKLGDIETILTSIIETV